MYIAGRLRTASSPSNTRIFSAVYPLLSSTTTGTIVLGMLPFSTMIFVPALSVRSPPYFTMKCSGLFIVLVATAMIYGP